MEVKRSIVGIPFLRWSLSELLQTEDILYKWFCTKDDFVQMSTQLNSFLTKAYLLELLSSTEIWKKTQYGAWMLFRSSLVQNSKTPLRPWKVFYIAFELRCQNNGVKLDYLGYKSRVSKVRLRR